MISKEIIFFTLIFIFFTICLIQCINYLCNNCTVINNQNQNQNQNQEITNNNNNYYSNYNSSSSLPKYEDIFPNNNNLI